MKKLLSLVVALSLLSFISPKPKDDWIPLFNGKNFDGWKINEHPETFTIENGAIVVHGERAHMFYDGPVHNHDFRNFEYKATLMTTPGSNSGMYILTEYQADGWPSKGFEIQVNNSHTDWRRTGSVYALKDVKVPPAKDNEWFTQSIKVVGKTITVKVNDKVINEYTESDTVKVSRFRRGTFALQGHDPKSKVYYKEVMVKPLPD